MKKKTADATGPKSWKWRIARSGKTMTKVSEMSGVHNTNLSCYASGLRAPSPETIKQVEDVLERLGV